MTKIITYGTFDLFHKGHENLLRRAKELGDYLIVGVTAERFDRERGKLNVHNSLMQRIEDVKNSGYADEIIVEEYEGQKIEDILRYQVDIFAIGSDWVGKFDYLNEYCRVVYLERTKGVSSTQLRNEKQHIVELGIIGTGRIANRFIPESKYVSGVNVKGVYNPNEISAKSFCERNELDFYTSDFEEFTQKISAVYIASPHLTHYDYIKKCLEKNLHVLCEKPMVLKKQQAIDLYELAKEKRTCFDRGVENRLFARFCASDFACKEWRYRRNKRRGCLIYKTLQSNRCARI
jgi:glycerol-3-phosphate cytidylyltransferase